MCVIFIDALQIFYDSDDDDDVDDDDCDIMVYVTNKGFPVSDE